MENKKLLLVNPWIHDFAAYNLWARPHGFLTFASFLLHNSIPFNYIDLLDVSKKDADSFGLNLPRTKAFFQGKFLEQVLPRPPVYTKINRIYRRFGLPPDCFRQKLKKLSEPSAVFVSSGMTYWYEGVRETISIIKECFPDVLVILGGNYATLCTEHALEFSGADHVLPGPWQQNTDIISLLSGVAFSSVSIPEYLPAANHLYPESGFAVIRFSSGCPFHCSYCASSYLSGSFSKRETDHITDEILYNITSGRKDIAVYDDALLVDAEHLLLPVLENVILSKKECRFHTPNGLHSRFMTENIANAFYASGFKTVRLSFESISGTAHDASDGKVSPSDLERALSFLFAAGYKKGDIDVYILMGIPGQSDESVFEAADYVHALGGNIKTAQYSPLPHTLFFARDCSLIPGLEKEPLLQNSTIAPGWNFNLARYDTIKSCVRVLNSSF